MVEAGRSLRIVLVDETPERARILRQALTDSGHEIIAQLCTGDDVVGTVEKLAPDVIVIDMESPDRDTLEGMHTITRQRPRPIVLFTNDDRGDLIRNAVRAGVTAYVVDGLSPKRVTPILETALARFEQFEGIRLELEQTKLALEDRKLIERAKGLLMKQHGLDEESAFKLLRKGAMDRNLRMPDLARSVIAAAELLS
jgi:response regulator NasT